MTICVRFKETSIYFLMEKGTTLLWQEDAYTIWEERRVVVGGRLVVLHLAVAGSFPADINSFFCLAPSRAFATSWKHMVWDCPRPDPLRVILKVRMAAQLQTVQYSILI